MLTIGYPTFLLPFPSLFHIWPRCLLPQHFFLYYTFSNPSPFSDPTTSIPSTIFLSSVFPHKPFIIKALSSISNTVLGCPATSSLSSSYQPYQPLHFPVALCSSSTVFSKNCTLVFSTYTNLALSHSSSTSNPSINFLLWCSSTKASL